MGIIVINGKRYSGNSVSITDNKVVIDGKVQHEEEGNTLKLIIEGSIENLECYEAEINGDILGDAKAHNLTCRAINGSVKGHNVKADYIEGNVKGHNVSHKT